MTRVRVAFVLFIAGCSGQPSQESRTPSTRPSDAVPVAPAQPAAPPAGPVETAPAPSATADPLLTPESAPDLTPQPAPAGRRVARYSYPGSYKPLHDGRTPASTPIPDLPVRKPARVLGDLRFLAPDGGLLYCGEGAGGNVPGGTSLAVRDVPGKRHLLRVQASDWS